MHYKTLIFIVSYIAVVFLVGFSIITITTTTNAHGFTVNNADVVAVATTKTTFALNTITNNVTGIITHVVDGDTLDLDINGTITRIRFALVNTPERGEQGYLEAKDFVARICPVGSNALFDADNGQKLSFGRVVGVIYCSRGSNGDDDNNSNSKNIIIINLNQALLQNKYAEAATRFCNVSEFSDRSWIKDQCGSSNNNISKQTGK